MDIVPDPTVSKLIIREDYNCVLNPTKDAHPSRTVKSKSAAKLNNYLKHLNLVDAWRSLHPADIDARLLQTVVTVQSHNGLMSDHAPISLDLNLKIDKGTYNW